MLWWDTCGIEQPTTLEEEENGARKKKRGILYGMQWLRVVLDEASNIKNPSTDACKVSETTPGGGHILGYARAQGLPETKPAPLS